MISFFAGYQFDLVSIFQSLLFEEIIFFFEPSICGRGIFRINYIILTCVFLLLQFLLDINSYHT